MMPEPEFKGSFQNKAHLLKEPRSLLHKKAFDTDLSYGSNDDREDYYENGRPRIVEYTASSSDNDFEQKKLIRQKEKDAGKSKILHRSRNGQSQ